MTVTVQTFENLHDHQAARARILEALQRLTTEEKLVRFLDRYATWNGRFAGGVAQLVANLNDRPSLFMEPGQPRALGDRSSYIASFFFDAARDEFDDQRAKHRDPHRSLAQATLSAVADITGTQHVLNEPNPAWFRSLCDQVVWSYNGGNAQADYGMHVFAGMGFHIGSELLADAEFSIIDQYLRKFHGPLVQQLMRTTVTICGEEHRAYAWIGVHSGHGHAAEADHFDWALHGANDALRLTPAHQREQAETLLKLGYMRFVEMHSNFFLLGDKHD